MPLCLHFDDYNDDLEERENFIAEQIKHIEKARERNVEEAKRLKEAAMHANIKKPCITIFLYVFCRFRRAYVMFFRNKTILPS